MCDKWVSRTSKMLDPSPVTVSGLLEKATKIWIRSNGISKAELKAGQDELKAQRCASDQHIGETFLRRVNEQSLRRLRQMDPPPAPSPPLNLS